MTAIREQLKALEQLQEIDAKAEGLKKQKTTLAAQLKPLQDLLSQNSILIAKKGVEVEDAKKFQRQAEAALQLSQDRMDRSGAKMSAVSKGNEFQAVSREVDQLKKQIETLKAQIKTLQEGVDAKNIELGQLQEKTTQIQGDIDRVTAQLSEESGKIDQDLENLEGDRAPFKGKVEKRVLLQYDRIRLNRGGIGLSPTVMGRCRACNMILPPQLAIQIQRAQELHNCPNCGRMLFHPESQAPTQ